MDDGVPLNGRKVNCGLKMLTAASDPMPVNPPGKASEHTMHERRVHRVLCQPGKLNGLDADRENADAHGSVGPLQCIFAALL